MRNTEHVLWREAHPGIQGPSRAQQRNIVAHELVFRISILEVPHRIVEALLHPKKKDDKAILLKGSGKKGGFST